MSTLVTELISHRYNVFCDEASEDTVLSIALDFHVLDTPGNCTRGPRCVDFVEMQFPTGGTCTTCGSKSLKCQEGFLERGNRARVLRDILHFSGSQAFFVKFKTDRKDPPPFRGFQFLTSCVAMDYYGAPGCINPTGPPGRRRSVDELVSPLIQCGSVAKENIMCFSQRSRA